MSPKKFDTSGSIFGRPQFEIPLENELEEGTSMIDDQVCDSQSCLILAELFLIDELDVRATPGSHRGRPESTGKGNCASRRRGRNWCH